MVIPLLGTLETVVLSHVHKSITARGTIIRNGNPIYVSNGTQALGKGIVNILARTDTPVEVMKRKGLPKLSAQTGNFVSSYIPEEIKNLGWLASDAYCLLGVLKWPGYWPSLAEINDTFDPGRMGKTAYFIKNGDGMWLDSKGPIERTNNYSDAIFIHLHNDPAAYSRVILASSEAQLPELETSVKEKGLIPVRMEPLQR